MARRIPLVLVAIVLVVPLGADVGATVTLPVQWTLRHPAVSPSARNQARTAPDRSGHVVLFGGCCPGSGFNVVGDTWTWDGTTWTERHQAASPAARAPNPLATDGTGLVVLFGGFGVSGVLGDTWTWDGTTWTQRHPPTSPPARAFAGAATDRAGRVVLFGGYDGISRSYLGDTWTWDGTTWRQEHPPTSPPARSDAAMATDPTTGDVVLFGGYDGTANRGDTWTWDGTTWTERHPTASPSARALTSVASDRAGRNIVLFGGENVSSFLGDTWTWDGTTWTQQTAPVSPSGRDLSTMAADPTGRVLLFGGNNQSGTLDDTWSITPVGKPTPPSKASCKKGGWRSYGDERGRPFRNQGQCVAFVGHRP